MIDMPKMFFENLNYDELKRLLLADECAEYVNEDGGWTNGIPHDHGVSLAWGLDANFSTHAICRFREHFLDVQVWVEVILTSLQLPSRSYSLPLLVHSDEAWMAGCVAETLMSVGGMLGLIGQALRGNAEDINKGPLWGRGLVGMK